MLLPLSVVDDPPPYSPPSSSPITGLLSDSVTAVSDSVTVNSFPSISVGLVCFANCIYIILSVAKATSTYDIDFETGEQSTK